ncbi:MAG: hypothetical protein H7A18_00865 [Sinobacteraceae bacterium]|nr:hypothetical protein [Nevskiaceae bacterium]MCP5470617.1 hypothetical protein [Nevskiaceae bacterium]
MSTATRRPLKAAAGAFSDPQHIEDDGFEWVAAQRYRHAMAFMRSVGQLQK